MQKFQHFTRFGLALFLIAFLALPVLAQFRSSIEGTVSDPSGAVLPGSTVTVTEQATGRTVTLTADAVGFYSVRNLLPGGGGKQQISRGLRPLGMTKLGLED